MGNHFQKPYAGDVCDPHLHFWDFESRPNPHHEGLKAKLPKWLPQDYLKAAGEIEDLEITSFVHVETIDEEDPEGETAWVMGLPQPLPYKIVCFVDLSLDTARDQCARQAALGAVGVRQILNKDPSWPNVREDFIANATFRENYKKLADHGLSFDAQLNPHQLQAFAELAAEAPGVPVMINHAGTLKIGGPDDHIPTREEHARQTELDDAALEAWSDGMKRLAALPHVSVKISMLAYTFPTYWKHEATRAKAKAYTLELVGLFGARRCAFASNYPVDLLDGLDMKTMYAEFRAMTADLPYADQRALFHDTAAAFYKLQ